jgi:transcription termination factor NusA
MSKEDITNEIRNRAEILEWMYTNDVRTYREVAKAISRYTENPKEFLKTMRSRAKKKKKEDKEKEEKTDEETPKSDKDDKEAPDHSEIDLGEIREHIDSVPSDEEDNKIKVFADIGTIDNDTAILLYDNGYKSIEDLKKASIKDLMKIEGMNKKVAKTIKKEADKNAKGKSEPKDDVFEQVGKSDEEKNQKIEAFSDLESIDENTAVLLYDNGYKTSNELTNITLKDLTRIKGIDKKTAKKIIKELTDHTNTELPQGSDEGGEMDANE